MNGQDWVPTACGSCRIRPGRPVVIDGKKLSRCAICYPMHPAPREFNREDEG